MDTEPAPFLSLVVASVALCYAGFTLSPRYPFSLEVVKLADAIEILQRDS